jgi:hypothetical protein
MLPTLNYDAVLSDPLLLLAGVFLVAGPLVFIVSLIKLISAGRKQKREDEYADLNPFSPFPPAPEPATPVSTPETPSFMEPEPAPARESESESLELPIIPAAPEPEDMPATDKTMVMPEGMGEVQGQLEIAFSQIKTLSKKVSQMESELDSVARNIIGKLDRNELKEPPMNPADFTQKLLKLAEHVIVLEKEVARLKNGGKKDLAEEEGTPTPPSSAGPKPPVMPL